MIEQLNLLDDGSPQDGSAQRARLATKFNDRTFCQATYFGRGGEVEFDLLVGVNLTADGAEIYRFSNREVALRGSSQHQRHVSTTIAVTRPPDVVLSWEQLGATYVQLKQFRTVALKREVARLLTPILRYVFV